jgi:hypothetical protein
MKKERESQEAGAGRGRKGGRKRSRGGRAMKSGTRLTARYDLMNEERAGESGESSREREKQEEGRVEGREGDAERDKKLTAQAIILSTSGRISRRVEQERGRNAPRLDRV